MLRRAAFAVAVVLAVSGCGDGGEKPSGVASLETVVTPTAETTPGSQPTPEPEATSTPTKTKTSAPPSGPQIVYFRIKVKATCQSQPPYGDLVPGSVTLEWKVTGADNVTISIDGPGIFDTYPVEHAERFNFSCDVPTNEIDKHTYLLKTVGGGTVRSKTITAEARAN